MSAFQRIEASVPGRLGVAAIDTGTGAHIAYRGDERFAMCMTITCHLGAAILAQVDQRTLSLDSVITYSGSDLRGDSPVTEQHVKDGMRIADLCAAAIADSDVTATNLLLRQIGGPTALTAFVRRLGDTVTRFDREAPDLSSNDPGDPRDTTTPDAAAAAMSKLLTGNVLLPQSRDKLFEWMNSGQQGLGRLRAGLPDGWAAGDAAGTGGNGASNDVAIAWPPSAAPLVIVSYLTGTALSQEARDSTHARVAQAIVSAFNEG
jgi:beta-lactamase class A